MKKLTLFLLLVFTTGFLFSQKPQNSGNVIGLRVPKIGASAMSPDTMRTPIIFKLMINGLTPGSTYKYYPRLISIADTASNAGNPGAGSPIFMRKPGNWGTASTPTLSTSGSHDTFVADNGGQYIGWFGVLNTSNSRFNPGNAVYPILVYQEVGSGMPIQKEFIYDSINLISYGTSSSDGTGIYGSSFSKSKDIIMLHDTNNTFLQRPVIITYTENEGLGLSRTPYWYNTNVNGTTGSWGTIIPNNLAGGIKAISHRDLNTDTLIYANYETDGIWGSSSTVNASGGNTNPIAISSNHAPLIRPVIEFVNATTVVTEGNVIVKIPVRCRYSNHDTARATISVVAGNASSPSDYEISKFNFKFNPYGTQFDTVYVQLKEDNLTEGSENIAIKIISVTNASLGVETTNTLIISDNDIPVVYFDKKQVVVNENNGDLTVKLKLDKGYVNSTSVKVGVKLKTDSTFIPQEFKIGSNNTDTTVSFSGGKAFDSLTFKVKIVNDNFIEDRNDSIWLVLRNPFAPLTVGNDSIMLIVIVDNDAPPRFKFNKSNATISETSSNYRLRIDKSGGNNNISDLLLRFVSGASSASEGSDFTFSPTSQIITFNPSDPDSVIINIPIIDNTTFEPLEKAVFVITSLSNALIQKPDTFTLNFRDNDLPEYLISKINTIKANGVADSIGTKCRVRGTVYGINMRPLGTPTGFQFTIMDKTGGIQVFSSAGNKGYTVNERDSVYVYGTVGQFNGMVQLQSIDTIIKLGTGNLTSAINTNVINESTESRLVKLSKVTLVDPSQWPATALAFNTFANLKVKNQTDTFNITIDSDTDIDGTPAPSGFLDIIGIGGQNDNTSPFTSNYILYPRRLTDIVKLQVPEFYITPTTAQTAEYRDSTTAFIIVGNNITSNQQISIVIKGGNATRGTDYQSNVSRTILLTPAKPSSIFKIKLNDDASSEQPETIIFVLRNNDYGTMILADSVHTHTIVDDESVSIKKLDDNNLIKVYPSPAKSIINIESPSIISEIKIFDINGKEVILNISSNNLNSEINIENLENGHYFIIITNQEGTFRKSFNVLK